MLWTDSHVPTQLDTPFCTQTTFLWGVLIRSSRSSVVLDGGSVSCQEGTNISLASLRKRGGETDWGNRWNEEGTDTKKNGKMWDKRKSGGKISGWVGSDVIQLAPPHICSRLLYLQCSRQLHFEVIWTEMYKWTIYNRQSKYVSVYI